MLFATPPRAESLETRSLLTAYFVDTDLALAAINTTNLQAGDQVLLKGGTTFNGKLTFDAQDLGTAASPILVTSYDASTGLAIDPSAAMSARATLNAGLTEGISITNTAGLDIVALNIQGAGRTVSKVDGIHAINSLAGDVKLGRLHFDHLDVSGFGLVGILVEGKTGKSGFSDVDITYDFLHDNGTAGAAAYGVFNAASTGYAHRDIYVGYTNASYNPGIAARTNSHTGNGIVIGDVDGAVIEHSVASYNGNLNTHVGGPMGIWTYDANNVLIQYNESHHNGTNSSADGGGFDLDGGTTNSILQYNYSHDNAGAGYGLFQFSGARAWKNNIVRFNLSVNDARKNGYGGIDFWNGGTGMSNAEVYNNTVIMDSVGSSKQPWAVHFATGNLSGIHLRNNNFVAKGSAGLLYVKSGRNLTDLKIQGNNWFASKFVIKWEKKSYGSLNSFILARGHERLADGTKTGLSVDPMFISSYGQIDSTSPLAAGGLNLKSLFGIDVGDEDLFGTVISPTPVTYSIGADWV